MKHTSGPWKIEQYQSTHKCHDVNFRCQSDAPDGLTKCAYSDRGRVSILQETHGSQVVICDMAKNKNNGYDARLIAAAPEMLEALSSLLNFSFTTEYDKLIEIGCEENIAGHTVAAKLHEIHKMGLAAIAKAEGR